MNKQEKIKILDKIIQQENCYKIECGEKCPLNKYVCNGGYYGKYPVAVELAKQEKQRLTTNRIIFNDSTYVDVRIETLVLNFEVISGSFKTAEINIYGKIDNNLFHTLVKARGYFDNVPLCQTFDNKKKEDRIIELIEKLINSIDVINLRLKKIATKEV